MSDCAKNLLMASDCGVLAGTTINVSLAEFPAPLELFTVLVVLRKLPVVVASTFTLKVQLAPPIKTPPDRVTMLEPAVAVIVPPPPQLPDNPLGVATTSPAGSVSVKLMFPTATVSGLV